MSMPKKLNRIRFCACARVRIYIRRNSVYNSPLVSNYHGANMRVPAPILDEKEFLRLVKENPVLLTSGNGIHDINIFRRKKRVTQGDGFLGNVLTKYGPKIFPFLKKYIFPAAKQMGGDMLSDMRSGRSTLKKSLKKRGLQSLGNITRKVLSGEGRGRRRAGVKRRKGGGRMGSLMRRRRKARSSTLSSLRGGGGGGGGGVRRRRKKKLHHLMTSAAGKNSRTTLRKKNQKKKSRGNIISRRGRRTMMKPKKRHFKKTISWKKKGCSSKKNKVKCNTRDIFSL